MLIVGCILGQHRASLIAQVVNKLPAIQETRVQFLGHEDPLEKGKATRSSVLAWKIPWTERSLVGYSPWGRRVRLDLETEHTYQRIRLANTNKIGRLIGNKL